MLLLESGNAWGMFCEVEVASRNAWGMVRLLECDCECSFWSPATHETIGRCVRALGTPGAQTPDEEVFKGVDGHGRHASSVR